MNRYKITEHYCNRVWYEKVAEVDAESQDQARDIFNEEIDGQVRVISDEEIDSTYEYSTIEDIEVIREAI